MVDVALGDEFWNSCRSYKSFEVAIDFNSDARLFDRLTCERHEVAVEQLLDLRADRVCGVFFLFKFRHRNDPIRIDCLNRDLGSLGDAAVVFGDDKTREIVGYDQSRVLC